MKLTDKQIKFLKSNKIVVLTTANKMAQPRSILVEVNQVAADKILITDNEMWVTRKNLLANGRVFILAFKPDYGYGLKISGTVGYYDSGKYYELVRNLPENNKFKPKGAVVVSVRKIEEF